MADIYWVWMILRMILIRVNVEMKYEIGEDTILDFVCHGK